MAIKFQKRIKIAPGIKLNLSRSGVSTTVGGKGLSVNKGKNGTHLNVGIPGTGISSRTKISKNKKRGDDLSKPTFSDWLITIGVLVVVVYGAYALIT